MGRFETLSANSWSATNGEPIASMLPMTPVEFGTALQKVVPREIELRTSSITAVRLQLPPVASNSMTPPVISVGIVVRSNAT